MSLPSSRPVSPAARAAADPPDDPPGVRRRSNGLSVVPKRRLWLWTSPAQAGRFVLPITTAPAARSRATATASATGTWSLSSAAPAVVRSPAVSSESFTVTGSPSSGRSSPAARASSAAAAAALARSASSVTTAPSPGSSDPIRPRYRSRSSRADISRFLKPSKSVTAGAKASGRSTSTIGMARQGIPEVARRPRYTYRVAEHLGGRTFGAAAHLIRSPDDAEQVAAEWMRHLGFADARCTGAGTDGGVDVRSAGAVAQVKAQLTPVGRPELQALYGVARSENRRPLFFSLMSYTAAALAWADEVGMALFRFDHAGLVEAVNAAAEELVAAAGGPDPAPPPAWPVRLSDRAGRAALTRERRGLLVAERVSFAGQGWLWVQLVRLDYTVATRRAVAHRAATLAFDLVSGAPFPLPGIEPQRSGRAHPVGEATPLAGTMECAAVLRQISDTWEKLESVTRPAAVERHRAAL